MISSVWAVDFEFGPGPAPRCMVARGLTPDAPVLRLWEDELTALDRAPFPTDETSVLTAYYASAEIKCFLALGWPLPCHVVDLFVEFRLLTNGRSLAEPNNLLGALDYFGLPSIAAAEKDRMRDLAIRGGPWTATERQELLDYCQTDVDALCALWPRVSAKLGWPL